MPHYKFRVLVNVEPKQLETIYDSNMKLSYNLILLGLNKVHNTKYERTLNRIGIINIRRRCREAREPN